MAEGCCAWPNAGDTRDAYKDCIKVLMPPTHPPLPSFIHTLIYLHMPLQQMHNVNVQRGGGSKINIDLRSSAEKLLKALVEAHQVCFWLSLTTTFFFFHPLLLLLLSMLLLLLLLLLSFPNHHILLLLLLQGKG